LIHREDFWRRFGKEQEQAQNNAVEFLDLVAQRGGLLRQDGQRYDFYIRRFQEFLAGRHLAWKLDEKWGDILPDYVTDDQWEEPLQLAAGFLAFTNLEKAEKFISLLAELKGSEVQQSHGIAVAGVCLIDLLSHRIHKLATYFQLC